MTRFLEKRFSVGVGGKAYGEGWDRIFGKKEPPIEVGCVCVVERRFAHGSSVQGTFERKITRVTPKRAYVGDRWWFALDDESRELKPRYLDYVENVAEIRPPA